MGPAHVACTPGRVDISNAQNFERCFLFERRNKTAVAAPSFLKFTLYSYVTRAHIYYYKLAL